MDDNLQERRKHIASFQCEPSTTDRLAELARHGERSLSGEIRLAVREHLERSTEEFSAATSPRSPAGAVDPASAGASATPGEP
jgi:hypothetical protein